MRRLTYSRTAQIDALRAKGWTIHTLKTCSAVIASSPDGLYAKGWVGKSEKPAFYHQFKTPESRLAHCQHWAALIAEREQRRKAASAEQAQKRAGLRAADHYTVGDVLYSSWGYEQTNVDYFEVIAVREKSIVIRQLECCASYEMQTMSGKKQPDRGNYKGEPITKILSPEGRVSMEFSGLYKWDGRARYYSNCH